MYPFKSSTLIVRDRWYIAAFSHEITSQPIERTLLGTPVVLYRTAAGRAVAMYGICPHRYYPLARGRVDGDSIVCGYHGFTFGPDGKCTEIPSQGTGANFCQPAYRLEERGPLCWIWMGNPANCDPALIPPYADFGLAQPGWRCSSFNHFRMNGRYTLLVDNLMDLTHLPYIHHHLEGGESLKKTPMTEEERPRSYRLVRHCKAPWGGFFEMLFGAEHRFDGLADFLSLTDFYGPELIRTSGPVTTAVSGHDTLPPGLGEPYILHGITPETETSTHYFGFFTRNFRLEDETLDAVFLASDIFVRQQDVDAIEAVESRLDAAAGIQHELLSKADVPAMKVRRRIQAMLDAEAAARAA